jgi:hypothetical protein
MKCALPLLLLSLAAFAQTGKQPKPLTNDDAAQHDATDFVRDLRGARATQFGPAFGFVSGTFPATDAVGKTIRFSAWIKTENVQNGYAGLWWRVDGPGEGTNRPLLAFDNSMVRFIDGKPGTGNGTIRGATGTTPWTLYELELGLYKERCHHKGGEEFRPEVAGVFFEDVKDLAHTSFPFCADEWAADEFFAMARKIDRSVMGVRVMSRALGKMCASSAAAAPLAAPV